ncbi:murein transglycosylase A [Aliarcobacter lanthieri]|uniref:murein transglycosylase A n=1 Tax=Arcobacteraceae TaxID=2808963 RepID=UPI000DEA6FD7|nr:murein transglycosylase A [Arcobacter sp. CECT 9188]RBQ26618.1 peptidoglycan N-acetylmuramoylhydrolase [Arcobacter sp. CECT 9188]
MQKNLIFLIITTVLFTSCATKKNDIKPLEVVEKVTQKERMERVSFAQIKGFFEDDLNYALEVFKKDCQKSKRFEELKLVCEKAQYANDGAMFFVSNFIPYKLYDNNSNDEGIITGYYEPLLYGSLKKTSRFKYPVYKIPKNLINSDSTNLKGYKSIGKIVGKKIVPYDTRKDIESNPNNKNLEVIAYVDDKIDLFFLQVQGSGKIQLDNGEIINIGYAGQNGRPYTSIGRYFIDNEIIAREDISVQTIKEALLKNPSKIDDILNLNESYVFFQVSNQGATGALNTVLTPKRNIAVDRSYIQLGIPVFLNTQNPITKESINQLMVAADVGGAIKGEIRADFFWGFGNEAYNYAGRMKEKGKMYILLPKIN